MYPTDTIFPFFFNFTEKGSPIEHFEVLGYEGGNFVPLTGSAFINIGLAVLSAIMVHFIQFICRKLYKFEIARKIGVKLSSMSVQTAIINFYLQSFLEMMICVLLSWRMLTFEDFKSGNGSDMFSAIFLIISVFTLAILPAYMLWKVS
jgi:hypothetical protein